MQNKTDEIDLTKLFGTLIDSRWTIIIITFIFAIIGVGYAVFSTPIYKADSLIQVEKKSSGVPVLGEMGELFSSESSSSTEMELIKSRMILGKTVDKMNLTTVSEPVLTPVIGKGLQRLSGDELNIDIVRFEINNSHLTNYILKVLDSDKGLYVIFDENEKEILQGITGRAVSKNGINIFIRSINAESGASFRVSKRSKLEAIQWLNSKLSIEELGRTSGIMQLTFIGSNKNQNESILNSINHDYLLQNVERSSAEAENSLVFLKEHLPSIKKDLVISENKLNNYQQENDSIDLNLEAKATLDAFVNLEKQLNQLTFKESEIAQKYTKEHPVYISLLDKRKVLNDKQVELEKQIKKLPITQREVLRLTRDVNVNQQMYVQLLNKVQEFNIVKASTVGNVRIIDSAKSTARAVKPVKSLIVIISTLLGLIIGVFYTLLKSSLNKGVENPDEIEKLGIPVYASIPMSDWQIKIDKEQSKSKNLKIDKTLLAVVNPADLSIEAIRSLRTSLHFAMMEAKNNILMISGPSPSIGKSFVSANMASVIAKSGSKIIVIDADMRKGRMERQMGVTSKPGLSGYLSDQVNIDNIVKATGVENLDFIARGDTPPNPSELLMHPRFKVLLDWASENYDIVLIDTPPILAVTDSAIVGSHAGTTLLVGRFGQNTAKEIEVAKQRFEQNGIQVKGFILNAVIKKAGNSYGYYNYSYE
nr:polysaccharide biosynthesis tyrosine autokinase [Photobacterium profundum]